MTEKIGITVGKVLESARQPAQQNIPMEPESKFDAGTMLRDVPDHYRKWRLSDYAPSLRAALEPFMLGRVPSVYLHGVFGSKKTSVAAALLAEIRMRGLLGSSDVIYGEFVSAEKLKRAMVDFENGPARMEHWKTCGVLVVDDLAAIRNTPHAEEQQLHLVCARYDRDLPIIATSNLTLAEMADHLDGRIASRLAEGVVLNLGDEDRRVRKE